MFINIRELDREPVRLDDEITIDAFPWEGGQTVRCGPVRLTGTLKPSRRGLELTAQISTVAELRCDRCLETYPHAVAASFRLFVVQGDPDAAAAEGEEAGDDPDAVDVYTVEGETLDLRDVLREQIDLALPVSSVCSTGCRGYCPGCGARLETEPCRCECPAGEAWSELREIREILARKSGRDRTEGD